MIKIIDDFMQNKLHALGGIHIFNKLYV